MAYSIENWYGALPYIDKPGKFWLKGQENNIYYGILREVSIIYDSSGGSLYFYVEDGHSDPVGNFEYFEPEEK